MMVISLLMLAIGAAALGLFAYTRNPLVLIAAAVAIVGLFAL